MLQVVRDEGAEASPLLLADLRVAVAGKIHQIPSVVDREEIDQLRFARDLRNLRQPLRAGEHVDERRFPDVRAADEREFRQG